MFCPLPIICACGEFVSFFLIVKTKVNLRHSDRLHSTMHERLVSYNRTKLFDFHFDFDFLFFAHHVLCPLIIVVFKTRTPATSSYCEPVCG